MFPQATVTTGSLDLPDLLVIIKCPWPNVLPYLSTTCTVSYLITNEYVVFATLAKAIKLSPSLS